ncbi:hypothetical protein AMTRI_Chr09g31810 [Amborella trichopoda]
MGGKETIIVSFILATLLLVVLSIALGKQKSRNSVRASRLPPGVKGWPFIGDTLNWYLSISSSHPPRFVEAHVKKYGKIFSCRLFGRQAVVSADSHFNRFILQNEGRFFQSSYPKSFRDLVGKNGVIAMQGEQQRRLHGIAVNMMKMDKLKFHFLNDIQVVLLQTLNNLQENENLLFQNVCRKLAINLMVNQLLGVTTEAEINDMAHLFSDFVNGVLSIPINLRGFPYYTAMRARNIIISKINKTIELKKHSELETGNSVLGRLLNEENLSDEAVADFIISLLFAGNETTAMTMLFAISFLSQSPKALKQLLAEQDGLRKAQGLMLTWEDYKSMHFTQCVIDETLRVGGIAISLMREAKENVEYQDFLIPKGCFVLPFLSAVHLDENVYREALIFNPWRWMAAENQEKRNWRSSPYYAPFGGGARLCPGAELARLQIALFLHYFVTRFRWVQLKEDRMSFFPSARLVHGFPIHLTRRQVV